jgi:hypothetical protein
MQYNDTLTQRADESLKPLLPVFKEIYDTSLFKMGVFLSLGESLTDRTKATLFHNIIMNAAKVYFPGNNVKVVEKYQSMYIVINNVFCGRFKKLNAKGLPSNINTTRNNAIISQQLKLFGEDAEIKHIDIGYKINSSWTEFEALQVICRNNKQVAFTLPFNIDVPKYNSDVTIKESVKEIEVAKRVNVKSNKENNTKTGTE